MLKETLILAALAIVGCSSPSEKDAIQPEPRGTGGASSASSSVTSGSGGSTSSSVTSTTAMGASSSGSGGSAGGSPSGGFESGSRLKARLLVGGDGSRQPIGWHDTMLDMNCAFSLASDGKTRCLPVGSLNVYFSDMACAMPIVQSSCTPPAYVSGVQVAAGVTCPPTGATTYTIGAMVAAPPVLYWTVGGACKPTGIGGPSGPFYLAMAVDPLALVAADEMIAP